MNRVNLNPLGLSLSITLQLLIVHSIKNSKPDNIIKNKEKQKKRKNLEPCVKQRHHCILIVVSCEGMLGKDA